MSNKTLILVVEDERQISHFISAILTSNDYQVLKASRGEEAIAMVASHRPDLVLLDLGLPDMDGLEVLKQLRSWTSVPVVVVSSRSHEREKVEALDLGADDYVTKPFGTAELLARIRTAIRHSQQSYPGGSTQQSPVTIGDLVIDYEKRMVTVEGQEVHLTPIEYKIIMLLSKYAGRVLTHDFMIKEIWGPYTSDNQILRVNMANIRRKIEKNPAEPRYILTEVGVGYRMRED